MELMSGQSRKNWQRSLSRRHRRSVTGSRKPIATRAAAATALHMPSAVNLRGCARRNKQLRLDATFSKAAAWFARETKAVPSRGSIRRARAGPFSDRRHVPCTGRLLQRLLCVGETGVGTRDKRRRADRAHRRPSTRPRTGPYRRPARPCRTCRRPASCSMG